MCPVSCLQVYSIKKVYINLLFVYNYYTYRIHYLHFFNAIHH